MFSLVLTLPHQNPVAITTDDSKLKNMLLLKYGKYAILQIQNTFSTVSVDTNAVQNIQVLQNVDAYAVTYKDYTIHTAAPFQAVEEIIHTNRVFSPDIFALHGAAVSFDNRAYLFLSASTGGKTTLTGFLTKQGLAYITDDCILLDRNSFQVHPYTTPLHLRSGGLEVLRQLNVLPDQPLEYIDEEFFCRYIYMPSSVVTTPIPVKKIFFIERTNDKNTAEEMSSAERMIALLKAPIIDYTLTTGYLHFIARLSQFPCQKLNYCDMQYVADLIHSDKT